MKNTLLLTLSLLLSACLSSKKVNEAYQQRTDIQQVQTLHRQYGYYQQRESHWESDAVDWKFVTGQPFYYHPDSGLYASEGELWMRAHSTGSYTGINDSLVFDVYYQDSAHVYASDQRYKQVEKERANTRRYVLWGILALLGLAVYWGCRKGKQH